MPTAGEVHQMRGNAALWEVAQQCERAISADQLPDAIVGGVAVCLRGHQRSTVDLDVLIRRDDSAEFREALEAAESRWDDSQYEFRSPTGIPVLLLLSGERAGRGSKVTFPGPSEPHITTTIEGLPVLSLAELIETKLVCGTAHLRRTHKDFADVVELIAIRGLNASFARHLLPALRQTFRVLVAAARSEP